MDNGAGGSLDDLGEGEGGGGGDAADLLEGRELNEFSELVDGEVGGGDLSVRRPFGWGLFMFLSGALCTNFVAGTVGSDDPS